MYKNNELTFACNTCLILISSSGEDTEPRSIDKYTQSYNTLSNPRYFENTQNSEAKLETTHRHINEKDNQFKEDEDEIILNNFINSVLEDSFEEIASSDESFYSFDSDDKDSEKRITFGSLKSIVEEEKYIDANERK